MEQPTEKRTWLGFHPLPRQNGVKLYKHVRYLMNRIKLKSKLSLLNGSILPSNIFKARLEH